MIIEYANYAVRKLDRKFIAGVVATNDVFDRVVDGCHPMLILVVDCWQMFRFWLSGNHSGRNVVQ